MPEDLDKIMKDIETDKQQRIQEEEKARKMLQADEEIANRVLEDRKNKVSGFKLALDLNEDEKTAAKEEVAEKAAPVTVVNESGSVPENASENETENEHTDDIDTIAENPQSKDEKMDENEKLEKNNNKNTTDKSQWGCVRGIVYGVLVLAASLLLAFGLIAGGLDMTGLNKSDVKVPVTLTEEQCKDTGKVAKVLKEAGVIDHPIFFQLYCKIKKANGQFQPQDDASLSPDMGYETIINKLKSNHREVVKVTFPEGSTIAEIAKKLEVNKVCSESDFNNALNSDKYTYDFLNEIPMDDAYKNRFNKLEGYIFPDTYEFYVGSSGESVVRKFLENFNNRVDITMRTAMKAKGMTLNDTIILASIIQWEGNDIKSMEGISCVLHNRLNNQAEYPRLECDSTRRYINSIQPPANGQNIENPDYDTYKRTGLPVGAINNPGLDAINAAINPATTDKPVGSYFFATDMKSNVTYYSKTFKEHEAICRKFNIGMYANKK